MYLVKTPWWLRQAYPSLTWKIESENNIYLTFDDGPHPTVTSFVLDTLQAYDAKATFFCIGKNVEANPTLVDRILSEGHTIGNHTHNHLNGWHTDDEAYIQDILQARQSISSNLFRPPYGRITRFQIKLVTKLFNIIMWDVLSGDFDVSLSPEACLKNVVSNTSRGSVIVFHDSEKAFPKLKYALPKALEYFKAKGFECKAIESK
jgi:peptidoglycan/xylan/chitin deacetylase (PgdA/CDA1 family)